MSRSTKRRADGDTRRPNSSPASTPQRASRIEVNPPARHPWFLMSGVIAIVAWILFLAVLAFQAN